MTIDEAIVHARKVADKKYAEGMLCHANPDDDKLDGCIECAREHEQLAKWLEELKGLRVDVAELHCELQAIGSLQGAYDKEIRNKTIDDFAEQLISSLANNYKHLLQIDTDGFAWLTTDSVETHINYIAELLKAENEYMEI